MVDECYCSVTAVRDFKNLLVWQAAMDLVEDVYRLTRGFPKHETWGLASQLQRAAVSVPSNIAEGRDKGSRQEYLQALMIARGSMAEVETQLLIAMRLNYLPNDDPAFDRLKQCYRLLYGLIRSLRTAISNTPRQ
ncbi:MAG: four helix bundle protein [Armatimonadia bacterium]